MPKLFCVLDSMVSVKFLKLVIVMIFISTSYVGATTSPEGALKGKVPCGHYGIYYKSFLKTGSCYKIENTRIAGFVLNDPDNEQEFERGFELNALMRYDFKVLKETEIGTLSAFIRIQANYDPGMNDDLVFGFRGNDFAVGLDSFEISLHREKHSLHIGKLENAGSHFISDGYTNKGAESLNARSGLGIAYQQKIEEVDFRLSLSDPRQTTDAEPIGPNFGIGVKRDFGSFEAGIGYSLINIDDFITIAPLDFSVRRGAPLLRRQEALYGYAFGADVKYKKKRWQSYVGATYVKRAANDAIFAFSDGFDALSLFAGLQLKFNYLVTLNADFSYISALNPGLRHLNGIDAATNLVWMPIENWSVLAELGFNNVDSFGAGNGFFFKNQIEGNFDFLIQVKREF